LGEAFIGETGGELALLSTTGGGESTL
jgi:hypothetical protein